MQRGDQTYALQVAMRVDAERLTLIGLSDLGQRLFTLSSDGHQARLISPSSDLKGLDPDLILTEFELVYWPLAELNTALPQELRLEQQGSLRTLWRGEKLLWFSVNESQDRWCGNVFIYNLERDYRLDIQPLSPVKPTS